LQVFISLLSVAVVDVGQEGDDTDDLTSILALRIVDLLLDQLMNFRLDVGFVEELTGK